MREYFKPYAVKYFDLCTRETPRNVRAAVKRWNALTDNAITTDARTVYSQLRNAAAAAVNVRVYCDVCNAIYKRTRRGYKLDIAGDGVKYFYSLTALYNFIGYNLDRVPLAVLAEYYTEEKK